MSDAANPRIIDPRGYFYRVEFTPFHPSWTWINTLAALSTEIAIASELLVVPIRVLTVVTIPLDPVME
jgi:hypothetical protein